MKCRNCGLVIMESHGIWVHKVDSQHWRYCKNAKYNDFTADQTDIAEPLRNFDIARQWLSAETVEDL